MSPVYATTDDYTQAGYGTPPVDATRLLATASRWVREATNGDIYDADDTGMPTDADTLAAFKDATTAQVFAWSSANVDPAVGVLPVQGARTVASKSLDGGTVTYDNTLTSSAAAVAARQRIATVLCDESARILRQAGLGSTRSWDFG